MACLPSATSHPSRILHPSALSTSAFRLPTSHFRVRLFFCEQLVNNPCFQRPVKTALLVNKFTTYFYGSDR